MALVERLAAEWPVISAAPYTHWLILLAGLVAAVTLAHMWNKREMNAIKAEKNSADAATKLAEKQRDGYKTEAENYRIELEKSKKITGPNELAPVMYGNSAIKEAFLTVTRTPIKPVRLPTPPATEKDFERFAAYTRLSEAGLADITSSPGATVVTSTSTAKSLTPQIPKDWDKWK